MRATCERGAATLFAAVALLVVAGVAALLVLAGTARAAGERVKGAADLAAVAGGRARHANADPCTAARRSAALNGVEVTACRLVGDEVEFVVTVDVRGAFVAGPVHHWFAARAHAGVVTGAPA